MKEKDLFLLCWKINVLKYTKRLRLYYKMTKIMPSDKIFIAKSKIPKAGLGVFASEKIESGEVIEECPTLVLPRKDYPLVKKTVIRNYHFMWGKSTSAICFGYEIGRASCRERV